MDEVCAGFDWQGIGLCGFALGVVCTLFFVALAAHGEERARNFPRRW